MANSLVFLQTDCSFSRYKNLFFWIVFILKWESCFPPAHWFNHFSDSINGKNGKFVYVVTKTSNCRNPPNYLEILLGCRGGHASCVITAVVTPNIANIFANITPEIWCSNAKWHEKISNHILEQSIKKDFEKILGVLLLASNSRRNFGTSNTNSPVRVSSTTANNIISIETEN